MTTLSLNRRSRSALTAQARAGLRALLALAGEDPDRAGLADTPDRVIRAVEEMTRKPDAFPDELLTVQFADVGDVDGLVVSGPIAFSSLCEHHMLPFAGHAWVGYLPDEGRIVGLSKLARTVEWYSRQLQVQERLTLQIALAIRTHLAPKGVGVVMEAEHTCMTARGARKPGATMYTCELLGALREQPATRAEFLDLTRARR